MRAAHCFAKASCTLKNVNSTWGLGKAVCSFHVVYSILRTYVYCAVGSTDLNNLIITRGYLQNWNLDHVDKQRFLVFRANQRAFSYKICNSEKMTNMEFCQMFGACSAVQNFNIVAKTIKTHAKLGCKIPSKLVLLQQDDVLIIAPPRSGWCILPQIQKSMPEINLELAKDLLGVRSTHSRKSSLNLVQHNHTLLAPSGRNDSINAPIDQWHPHSSEPIIRYNAIFNERA